MKHNAEPDACDLLMEGPSNLLFHPSPSSCSPFSCSFSCSSCLRELGISHPHLHARRYRAAVCSSSVHLLLVERLSDVLTYADEANYVR